MASHLQMVMDKIYSKEMPMNEFLQQNLQSWSSELEFVSEMARPTTMILVVFPIFAAFNTMLAAELLFVNIIGNIITTLTKWIINEDRPYWWVNEYFSYHSKWRFRQFASTCETSPGLPSGHLQATSASLFVLGYYFYRRCNELRGVVTGGFLTAITIVSISRMYLGAHFLHQCIAGACLGLFVAYKSVAKRRCWTYWKNESPEKILTYCVYMACAAILIFWFKKALGLEPQASIKMAFKWCETIKYINVYSTPIYRLITNFGSLAGLAVVSPIKKRVCSNGLDPVIGLLVSFLISSCISCSVANIPTDSVGIFYSGSFLIYFFQAVLLLGFVPKVAGVRHHRDVAVGKPRKKIVQPKRPAAVNKKPKLDDSEVSDGFCDLGYQKYKPAPLSRQLSNSRLQSSSSSTSS